MNAVSIPFTAVSFLYFRHDTILFRTSAPGIDIHVCVNSVNPFNWIKIGKILIKIAGYAGCPFRLPFMGPCLGSILRYVRRNHHTRIICIADNVIPHGYRVGDSMLTRYFIGVPHAFITKSEKVRSDLKNFGQKYRNAVLHILFMIISVKNW